MLSLEKKRENYTKQNRGGPLTVRQNRQLRKTKTRRDHEQNHKVLRETQRNRRQRFRDWMAGIRD